MTRTLRNAVGVLSLILVLASCTTTIDGKGKFDVESNLVTVPRLTGLNASTAEKKLESVGLVAEYDGDSTAKVVTQSPAAMVKIKKGKSVKLGLEVSSLTVTGTITLLSSDGYGIKAEATGSCSGVDGYYDIFPGAQVVVTGASSQTLALGYLEGGTGTSTSCTFTFSIPNVPGDESFYSVLVGNRDGPQYTKADISSPLALTLGS